METINLATKLREKRLALTHKRLPKAKGYTMKRSWLDNLRTLGTLVSPIDVLADLTHTSNARLYRTLKDESQVDAENDPRKHNEIFSHGNGKSQAIGMLRASIESQDSYDDCESKNSAEVDNKIEANLVMLPSEQTVDSDEDDAFGNIIDTIRSENKNPTFSEYKSEHQNEAKKNTVKTMKYFTSSTKKLRSGLFNKKSKRINIFSRNRSTPAKALTSHHHTSESTIYPTSSKGKIETTSSKTTTSMTKHSVIESEIGERNLASPLNIPVKDGFRSLSFKRLQTNLQFGKGRAGSFTLSRPWRPGSMSRNKSNVTEKTTCEIENIMKKKKLKRKLQREMKTFILQAFRETSSIAMLEKEGGTLVLEALDLFSILAEAIRLDQRKLHETASSVPEQDLPQQNEKNPLNETIVEVCMKHVIIRQHQLLGTMMDDNEVIFEIKSTPEDDSGLISVEKTEKNENKFKTPETKNLSIARSGDVKIFKQNQSDIHQSVALEKKAKGKPHDLDGEDVVEDSSVDNATVEHTLEEEEDSLVTFNNIVEEYQLYSPEVDDMESCIAGDDHSTLSEWTEFIEEGVDRCLQNNIDDHVISSLTDLGFHFCMKNTNYDILQVLRTLIKVDSDDDSIKDEITSSDSHIKNI